MVQPCRRLRDVQQEAMSEDSGDEGCAETNIGASTRKEPFDDDVQLVFATAHLPHDPLDEKYAFCVGLAAHGFCTESFHMAVELATGLITDIPSTVFDISPSLLSQAFSLEPSSKRRWNFTKPGNEAVAQIRRVVLPDMVRNSQVAEELLIKASFLVKTLCDTGTNDDSSLLAMQLALKVMSNARGPAGTRHHEVAIHYLEEELFRAVHKIPIGPNELRYLRQFANDLMSRATHSVPQRITVPASLTAHYLLDALSCSTVQGAAVNAGRHSAAVAPPVMTPTALSMRKPTDDDLALAVALDALSKHVFVSEMDHPMLCECIRRQRGDLAMTLLLRYKDSVDKLGYVMDRILDPRIHRIYEYACPRHTKSNYLHRDHKSNAAYFVERSSTAGDRFLLLLLESSAAYANAEEPAEEEELAKEVTDKLVCYADS
ncbi:SWIM zinc finger family protein, partial [Aphelenchoides avenae]